MHSLYLSTIKEMTFVNICKILFLISLENLRSRLGLNFAENGAHLVVCHTGRFVWMLTLNNSIVIRGGTSREALFRLVSSCAISWLIGVECRGCILLIQNGNWRKQLLDKAKNFYSNLVDIKKKWLNKCEVHFTNELF